MLLDEGPRTAAQPKRPAEQLGWQLELVSWIVVKLVPDQRASVPAALEPGG